MDLWFVTSLNTEKIEEIRQNPKVGVLFYRDSDNAYVSISGLAHIEQNRDLIKRKWKDEWSAWFPGGPEQEDLALIAIDAHEAEYWEPKAGKLTVTFEAPRGALTGEHPELK
jgi:general stress protein 26